MAMVFQLLAEGGTSSECAALVRHFDGLQMTLLSGGRISWAAGATGLWNSTLAAGSSTAMVASSPDLNSHGPRTLQDVLECTESGIRLLPPFEEWPAIQVCPSWVGG